MLPKISKPRRALIAVAAATAVGVGGVAASSAFAAAAADPASRATAAQAPRTSPEAEQDGRDLFAGLFFLQGETGKEFAELRSYTGAKDAYRKNNNAEARKAVTRVLEAMAKKDASFFSDFSAGLRSGDPRKVESAMNDAVALLTKVTVSHKDAKGAKDVGTGTGRCAVLAVNVLIVVNAGGAVNVSVAVNLQAWKNVVNMSVGPADDSGITKEQQIADITRFAAA
ncbi:hypothetical protein [Streptomyces sp. KN37]|uniref:hypothetical protein n=1 Tax=Streptomyces sp. KN37 TaxID=3090667 RepID=UPI002A76667D|nr:hypothetical protein [Streptomyces sp. KN37]WPO76201.1 hypothetical protein R9806_36575 [Streptomyces sp. KN37]